MHVTVNLLVEKISGLTDEQIARMLFSNFRGREAPKGLRLTNFGLQTMRGYFQSCEVKLPEGHTLSTPEILYLDHHATLPYHVTDTRIVVFESDLGMKLKLADGDIGTLIEIDEPKN